jgi:hypothetical protein
MPKGAKCRKAPNAEVRANGETTTCVNSVDSDPREL